MTLAPHKLGIMAHACNPTLRSQKFKVLFAALEALRQLRVCETLSQKDSGGGKERKKEKRLVL